MISIFTTLCLLGLEKVADFMDDANIVPDLWPIWVYSTWNCSKYPENVAPFVKSDAKMGDNKPVGGKSIIFFERHYPLKNSF